MKMKSLILIFFLSTVLLSGEDVQNFGEMADRHPGYGIEGYAGPGWAVFFAPWAHSRFYSTAPLMFRINERIYSGPVIVYDEGSSESENSFFGGMKLEWFFDKLSLGFYSTSASISAVAGAGGLAGAPRFAAQISADVNANFVITPTVVLAAGPAAALRFEQQEVTFLPGISFALKEGTRGTGIPGRGGKPMIEIPEEGAHISGMWQGLWVFVNRTPVFIDGGGTRLVLSSGLAFGITGGVLKQNVVQNDHTLSIMIIASTAEWTWRPAEWFALSPRITSGVALFGWVDAAGQIDGGPHFMARPEFSVYLGVLPFVEVGGGIGYQFVTGEAETAVPISRLSSIAFSVQVRVGAR